MYSRRLNGKTLDFEHARFLHQGSFVMYDVQTGSLWIHTTGEAVIGKHKSKTLDFLPSVVTTWKSWRSQHPATLVLNVKKGKNARFNLQRNPTADGLSVGQPDEELRFYPFAALQQAKVINDELAGTNIVVVFDEKSFSFAAFERGERTFHWEDGLLVDQAGKKFSALQGTSGETVLTPVPAVTWLTKAWQRFYPEGTIYRTP